MFSKPKYSAILVILAFVVLSVNGQLRVADPDPPTIAAKAGETVNLLCRFSLPVSSCNFIIPGEKEEVKVSPKWNTNDRFRYHGSGLENGECGVTILSVTDTMHGNATCRLDINDGLSDARATIPIVIAKAPEDPIINLRENNGDFEAGDDIDAQCTSIDGRPAASLNWFLEDQFLGSGNVEITDSENPESTYSTAVSTISLRLKPENNNARLICSASHVGFPDGTRNTSHQLSVRFKPVPLSEINISGLEIGKPAIIGPVTIHANPAPSIMWVIDGKVMNSGSQNEKFIIREATHIGNGKFNASLQVVSLTLEDTTRSYTLRATNAIGTTDYKVRIGGSSDVAATGLSIVTIIAISIISLFVLVVFALIVVARVTKRWCFAGDSMHPNGPDSEAQIAPEDDKTHEHYEQHEKSADEEPELETANGEGVKATNGKPKGNTSV